MKKSLLIKSLEAVKDAQMTKLTSQCSATVKQGYLGKTVTGEMCAFETRQGARDFAGNSGTVEPIGISLSNEPAPEVEVVSSSPPEARKAFEVWASSGPHVTLCHVFSFTKVSGVDRYLESTSELCWRAFQAALTYFAEVRNAEAIRRIKKLPSLCWWHPDNHPVFNNANGDDLIKRKDVLAALSRTSVNEPQG